MFRQVSGQASAVQTESGHGAAARAATESHEGRFEQQAPLDLGSVDETTDQRRRVVGLHESPAHELVGEQARRPDVEAVGIRRDLEGELFVRDPPTIDERHREAAKDRVEHPLVPEAGEEERLANGGWQRRAIGLLDHQHPTAARADAGGGDEGPDAAADDHRVPAPGARGFAPIEGGDFGHGSRGRVGPGRSGSSASAPTFASAGLRKPGSIRSGASPGFFRSIVPM